jgi:hypothetical protein
MNVQAAMAAATANKYLRSMAIGSLG